MDRPKQENIFPIRKEKISLLVFHCFALPTPKMLSVFKKTRTGAHYLIQRNGKVLSLVPENRVTYHAGHSLWRQFDKINQHSISIEIQNPKMGEIQYTKAQIQSIIKLSKRLIKKHHIAPKNVIGHSDIAPIRKPDPGRLFPWKELAQHGIGLYPSLPFKSKKSSDINVSQLLKEIGYDTTDLNAAIYSFTKHFLPSQAPHHPQVIEQEAKAFQYWQGIQKSDISTKLKKPPKIYPQGATKLLSNVVVFDALQQVALLYRKKK